MYDTVPPIALTHLESNEPMIRFSGVSQVVLSSLSICKARKNCSTSNQSTNQLALKIEKNIP